MSKRAFYASMASGEVLWVFASKADRDWWVGLDPLFRDKLKASSSFVRAMNKSINPNLVFFSPMAKSAYYKV